MTQELTCRIPAAQDAFAPIPENTGIGLKPQHYIEILETHPQVGWFEVHAENYMGDGGSPHRYLTAIRERYPLSLHGVGLSLGSSGPLDREHAFALKRLVDRYEPFLVSEHLAWTRHGKMHFNDLLPLPLTQDALDTMVEHVSETQDILGREILIENPSVYVSVNGTEMSEPEFLASLARRSGCRLLVDVNNVYVSTTNCGGDPAKWLSEIPAELVGEVHIAGHATEIVDGSRLLIDDHGSRVCPEVLDLLHDFLGRVGPRPILIEWDTNVPDLDVLIVEARRAHACIDRSQRIGTEMGRRHG